MEYCKNCQKEVNKDAIICVNCGYPLKNDNQLNIDSNNLLGILSIVFSLIPFIGPPLSIYILVSQKYARSNKRLAIISLSITTAQILLVLIVLIATL